MTARRERRSVNECIYNFPYYGHQAQSNLQASCKNSLDFVQRLSLMKTLNVHSGCVNTVNWNASGTLFVSGSDDNYLVVTEAKRGRVVARTKTQHKRHIFSARFMPFTNDQAIVSCSGEGIVLHTEFLAPYGPGRTSEEVNIGESGRQASFFDCHAFGSTYDVLPIPDTPRVFLSCGEDGTVRCIDLRVSSRCAESVCDKHIYITAPCAITAMDVAPISHHKLVIGCSDSIVRLYDRRMLSAGSDRDRITWPLKAYPIPMKYTRRHYRPTCVKYSADESELLVSYSMEQLYLFDLNHPGYNDADLLRSGCYTPKLRRDNDPEPQMPRLRFRGDWSDTGPNSMANIDHDPNRLNVGQARPPLVPSVLRRLSDEIIRMLNSQTNQIHAINPASRSSSSSSRSHHMSWQDAVLRTLDNQSESATSRTNSLRLVAANEITQAAMAANNNASAIDAVEKRDAVMEAAEEGKERQLNKFDYIKMSFSGHRNSRTMVKGACFWGDDYIMSGSDCGHIFIWQRHTGKVVKTLLADHRVVNRVQPHPTLPYLLSSGIDYNIKLWAPIGAISTFDEAETTALIKSNEIMLVETRDTITVPAQVMIRILAGLRQYHRIRHASGTRGLGVDSRRSRNETLRAIEASAVVAAQEARRHSNAQRIADNNNVNEDANVAEDEANNEGNDNENVSDASNTNEDTTISIISASNSSSSSSVNNSNTN
ncbi:PREDICTED: DDB1- and CUL4-associated factor 6-like [Drosophila arizonae]|uniref:DDB1- and CUL4-associated factor 6-like n=1 Tax=Drosophila arizonae TaxID=7263 RepID=A0ABM1PUW3_DROAR|nr:PREDICTED: DDB1- and CUL4-associated factor 6-like [Drosophila arizonae]XP_017870999.1 PREDICTED: DDB1- and CUL4-associated factor 6-like [Drosophila arizonae]